MIQLIDASSVQGLLQIERLHAAGIRGLIHKCKQGNDGKDPFFERNIAAATAQGWYRGKYDFLYPLPHLNPEQQAEGFFEASKLGAEDGDIPPVIDFEWPDPDKGFAKWGCTWPQVNEFARRACERSTVLVGRKPIIYIYPYFAHLLVANGGDTSWLKDYALWIASYGGQKPAIPTPWTDWAFWQYDGNGGRTMPNGADADFNWFNGDDAVLAAFCKIAQPIRVADSCGGNAAVDDIVKP
jgi:GH25 family lysozyme M1 (1,4-beta-N-acetylmuramidase)